MAETGVECPSCSIENKEQQVTVHGTRCDGCGRYWMTKGRRHVDDQGQWMNKGLMAMAEAVRGEGDE